MKRASLCRWLVVASASCISLVVFAYPTVYPTGTTIYFPDQAYSSYILISDHADLGNHPSAAVRATSEIPDDVRLIDMNGNVVHTWKVATYFNKRSRLMPNGHLLYAGPDATIIEYDWDGNVVWQHQGIGSVNDLRYLPNDNRLLIAHQPIPEEAQAKVEDVDEKIAPWWAPRKRGSEEHQNGADIYEINPQGEVVWEWHAHDHIDLNLFSPLTPVNDWLHVNSIAPLPENKWFDGGDERFRPGNIILNARNINMMYIIDKAGGDIVWEGTHDYKGGMAHSHEPEMIEKGLPGAGNIILFDNSLFPRNRTHTGQTFIIEMNPLTQEIVWKYETEGYANIKFFSKTMGSQKRLPNGNTYIAEDNTGRLFQVETDGTIVWEFVNRGGTTRPSVVPYDFTPQLRAMNKPLEQRVTPPNNLEWQLSPDEKDDLLARFAGSYDISGLLDLPPVRAELESLLGDSLEHLRRNISVTGAIDVIGGMLSLTGNAPHGGTEEEAVVCIVPQSQAVHAAIFSSSEIAVYTRSGGYDGLPRCIKDWVTEVQSKHVNRVVQPANLKVLPR